MDLFKSKWAPTSKSTSVNDRRTARKIVSRVDELAKAQRLFKRLQWKSSLLRISYDQATAYVFVSKDIGPVEAKAMFKVDFFEFYVLLERLLVHLLGVFRVPVSRTGATATAQPAESLQIPLDGSRKTQAEAQSIIGSAQGVGTYHRFHAEVLRAFDQPKNPLHDVLGVEPVRTNLQNAKDFRNKWKDTIDSELLSQPVSAVDRGLLSPTDVNTIAIENLNLGQMLDNILQALDKARAIAEAHIQQAADSDDGPYLIPENVHFPDWLAVDTMDIDEDGFPYEAMPDGMDWQSE